MTEYTKSPHEKQDNIPQQMGLFEREATKRRRLTEFDYHRVGVLHGIRWVGDVLPKSSRLKTKWQCPVGYTWEAKYNNIQQGRGCPHCARVTLSDYHKMGTSRGIRWIGDDLPKNVNTKTKWHCNICGYTWEAHYSSIQQGSGCPHCAGVAARTKADYHKVGDPRGIQWVGDDLPKNAATKTSWQCPQGDVWDTTYNRIQSGDGCPHCQRLTEFDYHRVGILRCIRWIGDELPKNSHTKTKWQCPEGDTWDATYHSIYNGRGCPACANMVNGAKVSSQQEWLCNFVAGEMNIYHEGYCLDIVAFIDGVNIAIEYDGWHWHKDNLDKDAKRDAHLIAAGWRVLRVKSGELLPNEQNVLNAIKRLLNGSNYEEIILADWGASLT